MRGGRLKVVNESSYPDEEVERLVRFGLAEIDLTGDRIVVLVKHTRATRARGAFPAYSGTAYSLDGGIPAKMYARYCGQRTHTRFLLIVRLGPSEVFPTKSWRRYGGVAMREYQDWREALVAVTAHEAMHSQHRHDGGYRSKSGERQPAMMDGQILRRGGKFRVGVERDEGKCEAFENYVLDQYRKLDHRHSALLRSVG